MKIRACPLCRQVMLVPNAGTVPCGTCSFPMTRQTLTITCESDLPPLNESRSYVRVGPKGGPYATSPSHRRTDSRQATGS